MPLRYNTQIDFNSTVFSCEDNYDHTKPPPSKVLRPGPNSKDLPRSLSFNIPQNRTEIVEVLVGDSSQKFIVHKSFLCHHSKYFERSLNSQYQEGQTGIVKLKDTDPNIFGSFVDWVYTGQIMSMKDVTALQATTWKKFIDLFLLADYFKVPHLQNYVIDLIFAKGGKMLTKYTHTDETVHNDAAMTWISVWEKLPDGCQLRKFIFDSLRYSLSLRNLLNDNISWPNSLLLDLLKVFVNQNTSPRLPAILRASDYYVSTDEVSKTNT